MHSFLVAGNQLRSHLWAEPPTQACEGFMITSNTFSASISIDSTFFVVGSYFSIASWTPLLESFASSSYQKTMQGFLSGSGRSAHLGKQHTGLKHSETGWTAMKLFSPSSASPMLLCWLTVSPNYWQICTSPFLANSGITCYNHVWRPVIFFCACQSVYYISIYSSGVHTWIWGACVEVHVNLCPCES